MNTNGNNHISHDHEMFLQAFEKPTQIYRELGMRNAILPIFLHRNLSYMKDRMSRSHKSRKDFKVDQMLTTAEQKYRTDFQKCKDLYDYMSLMFIGVYNKYLFDQQTVKTDVYISNAPQRKRMFKVGTKPVQIGSANVKVNPDESFNEIPAVSIPMEYMKPNEYSGCVLTIRVIAKQNGLAKNNDFKIEPIITESQSRIIYEAEMLIFDKHNRCLLFDGDYEVNLIAIRNYEPIVINETSPKKHSVWEDLPTNDFYDTFHKLPILKFRLTWTKDKCNPYVDRPLPITIRTEHQFKPNKDNHLNHNNDHLRNGPEKTLEVATNNNNNKTAFVKLYDIASRIIYRFIYNNHSSQQTEACDNFNCPWCNLNCIALYSLLKHLKLCHPRFNFTYVPTEKSVRIDVTINDMFDCSYSGSPFDLVCSNSVAATYFSKCGPLRRTIVTHILVCHPRRVRPSLTEFLEIDENELNTHRPFIAGHNRTYYHIMTYMPIMPKEFDTDSEDENDPVWLRNKTINMIDEFTDVNDGEKELMKMWNLHVMRYNFVGDIQIPLACEMFLEERGKELLQKNLCRNFVLHLSNLFDYGLLSPQMFYGVILKMRAILCTNNEGRNVFAKAHHDHLQNWLRQQNDRKSNNSRPKQHSHHHHHHSHHLHNTNGRPDMKKRIGRPRGQMRSARGGRTRSSFSPKSNGNNSLIISPNRKRSSLYRSTNSIIGTPSIKKYASDTGNNKMDTTNHMINTRRRRAVQSLPDVDLRNRDNKIRRFTRNRSQSQIRERRGRPPINVTRQRKI